MRDPPRTQALCRIYLRCTGGHRVPVNPEKMRDPAEHAQPRYAWYHLGAGLGSWSPCMKLREESPRLQPAGSTPILWIAQPSWAFLLSWPGPPFLSVDRPPSPDIPLFTSQILLSSPDCPPDCGRFGWNLSILLWAFIGLHKYSLYNL